jgi:hypothetical protein
MDSMVIDKNEGTVANAVLHSSGILFRRVVCSYLLVQ